MEYEAWDYQLRQAERLNLTCEMILEIERQLYFYGKILQNKGRGPATEEDELNHYSMPDREQRVVVSRCNQARN